MALDQGMTTGLETRQRIILETQNIPWLSKGSEKPCSKESC